MLLLRHVQRWLDRPFKSNFAQAGIDGRRVHEFTAQFGIVGQQAFEFSGFIGVTQSERGSPVVTELPFDLAEYRDGVVLRSEFT